MIILVYSVTLTPRTSLSEISKNILKANYLKVSYLNCVTFIVWDTYFRFYDYSDSSKPRCATRVCTYRQTQWLLAMPYLLELRSLNTPSTGRGTARRPRPEAPSPPRCASSPRHLHAPQPALPFTDLFSLVAVLGQSTKQGELCYSKCTQQSHLNVWSTNSVRNWNDFDIKP